MFEDREKQWLTWLLSFNFPLEFLVYFLWRGWKEKPSQLITSLPGLNQFICCWVFELWIQYYLMFPMWKLIKCQFKSKLEEEFGEPKCTVYWRTILYMHTQYILCTSTYTKTKFIFKNGTFSTILDVTRRLAWIPGYERTISYCHPTLELVWLHQSLLIILWLAVTTSAYCLVSGL